MSGKFLGGAVAGISGLAIAVLTFSGGSTAAQESGWYQWRTTQGCLFYQSFDPANPSFRDHTYEWVGSCTPGQVINGQGSLDLRRSGSFFEGVVSRSTGLIVEGCKHGLWPEEVISRTRRSRGNVEDFTRTTCPGAIGVRPAAPAQPSAPPRAAPASPPAAQADVSAEIRALRQRAERGEPAAQYDLGYRYRHGNGVPQSDAEAVRWYRLSAAQGHAQGQNGLAVLYDMGRGVPRHEEEARRLYRLALQGRPDDATIRNNLRRLEDRIGPPAPPGAISGTRFHMSNAGEYCLSTRRRSESDAHYIRHVLTVANACDFSITVDFDEMPQSEGRRNMRAGVAYAGQSNEFHCLEHRQDRDNPLRPVGCLGLSDPRERVRPGS